MPALKTLPLLSVMTLCVLTAACGGQSQSADQSLDSAAATTDASETSADGMESRATSEQPTSSSSAGQAQKSTPSPSTGDSPVLRPSYDDCITAAAGATPAMQDCIAAEHAYQDEKLNKVYKALIERLGDEDKSKLRDQQRQWIADRDEKCLYDPDSGQAGIVDAAQCRLEMTAERAAQLESR
ncbi:uncharacterized protein YecT (DUF1311 family) [Xanthomonas arboricola]|uniref:lysozyme inhibitor LprI family protein n=1 Tax=Xanthomonas sp. 3793 TaxID=3035312 RepID=UPI002169D9DB|nr:lysozyme inhibitor LprI family protein [Xanthomonas sp. 3793]MCS3747723.1 uncharacterized protein YecT (DUF1311 family) [Xanthomonas sp. 3793]